VTVRGVLSGWRPVTMPRETVTLGRAV